MSRTSKILGFSVPPALVAEVETLAKKERRTKSELFREMLRVYRRFREERDREETRWVANLVRETKREEAANPMTVDDILKESERLARAGEKRAKKRGIAIDPKSVTKLIHERRKAQRPA